MQCYGDETRRVLEIWGYLLLTKLPALLFVAVAWSQLL